MRRGAQVGTLGVNEQGAATDGIVLDHGNGVVIYPAPDSVYAVSTMVLFLDFDGVLHPDAAFLVKGRPTLKTTGELFMWAPLLVELLADLPEVQIVLSTSWARALTFDRARRWLPQELHSRVIGSTWHSAMSVNREGLRNLATWWDEATRYQQIKRYAGRAGLSNWVAIDDQPEGWGADDLDKLVHTNCETGLSDPAALALLAARLEGLRKPEPC